MMKINPTIFREYDIRGFAESDITAEFAKTLGLAYAAIVHEKFQTEHRKESPKLAVGRDCRLTSDEYAEAVIAGLLEGGVDVLDIGLCPTPLTYFSLFRFNLDGCVMITASHNPGEYNGFKICLGKDSFYGESLQVLRKKMEGVSSLPKSSKKGSRSSFEIIPEYLSFVKKGIHPGKRLKIVLDAGNATASTVAPKLFELLEADVIPLFCELDGRFPNHHPDPTVESNLKVLIETVRKEKADLGVAFDGDSDRIGVVDENGKMIFGDMLMIILSRAVLAEKKGGTVLSEVKSSHRLYEDIRAHGGNAVMWKTGHSLIKTKMKEMGAVLAGEMSGHVFFADRYFGYDDAIYTAARLYEILSFAKGPLSSLLAGVPQAIATPEIRIDCEDEKKFLLVEEAKKEIHSVPGFKMNDMDGIRLDSKDGWGLVRASNTQPVLVLRFEAENSERLNEIRRLIEDSLSRAAERIGHPKLSFEPGLH